METDRYLKHRLHMVDTQIKARGIHTPEVLQAFIDVPRHRFVTTHDQAWAYGDHPLSIGMHQTISQPYIVALMTNALAVTPEDHVLEIGTGSGYQTAILACLAKKVYTIERIESLQRQARTVLDELGYDQISYKVGNGFSGWVEHAPYDAIVVTAAPEDVPKNLVEQLKEGGRLVIPIGSRFMQMLFCFVKRDNQLHRNFLCHCRFVEMIRDDTNSKHD